MLKRVPIFWGLAATLVLIIVLGFILLEYLSSGYSETLSPAQWRFRTLLAVVVVILLSCGAAWFLLDRLVKRPVREVSDGMARLANKEFDFRLEEDEKSEFGALAVSFNEMAAMLSASMSELKKNQDYLRGILESSADFIITVNPSGRIQTFNSGAEQGLGYRRLEVIGQPIEMLFADPSERAAAIAQLDYRDNVTNYETHFLTKDGEIREVLLTLSQLRNPDGEIIGTIGISKDVTEEKRLQAELLQSQRFAAIGQVFTSIQHSMKNMLNAMKGGSYMVKTGLAIDDRAMLEDGWKMVQEGISRVTDLSLNMLKYVKEFKPKLELVDLSTILENVKSVIGRTAEDKGVVFATKAEPKMPKVPCDADMIHSVIMDIVSNAIDACAMREYKGGDTPRVEVDVRLSRDGERAVIEIKDNGIGMTEKVRANIFTPFFSTKSKTGTGLGLSIASRMINVHGGRIDVESAPDEGATFLINLPVKSEDRNQEDRHG